MNLKEQYAALLQELRGLADKAKAGTLSDEEAAAYDTKSQEARSLKTKIDDMERRSRDAGEFDAEFRRMSEGAGPRAGGRTEGRESGHEAESRDAQEMRSIGRRFIESDQFREYRAAGIGSKMPSEAIDVRSFWHGPDEARTLVYTGALPSQMVRPDRVPGVFMPEATPRNVRSAFLNGQTQSNLIEFYRELAFTNNAAAVSEATATSATTLGQSGVKPESALTFEQAEAAVQTLAHWIPITDRALEDEPQLMSIIEGRLIDGLALVEDSALLNGDGSSPNIRGILNVSGVQALDASYFSGTPVQDAGTKNENFNRILRARRLVRITGRATPNFVILNPADLEKFLTHTDAQRQYLAGGPYSTGSNPASMWGLRVIESESIAAGTSLVGDGRMAAVWDRMQATVQVGMINDQFIRNMKTILAEERLTLATYRPAAFAIVTLA